MVTQMKAWWQDARGISMPLALVVLALGTLLVGPLLWRVGTGYSATQAVETNLYRQYSSDAGAEYALHQLRTDQSLREQLLGLVGETTSLTMPDEVNGAAPTIEVVCVSSEPDGGPGASWFEYALFALEAGTGIHFNGGHNHIYGPVHSNGNFSINGGGNSFYDQVTAVSLGGIGNGNSFADDTGQDNPLETGEALESPFVWDIAMFDNTPGNHEDETWVDRAISEGAYHVHSRNWSINGEAAIEPGLHYVDGNVSFNGGHQVVEGITVVATGRVSFNGGHRSFTPYVDGLGIMTTSSSNQAVNLNGGHGSGGAVYAPNGGIAFNGGHNLSGAFVASHISFNGGHNRIDAEPVRVTGGACGVFDIRATADGLTTHVRTSECETGALTVLAWQLAGNGDG
jgi:hypothetical protein